MVRALVHIVYNDEQFIAILGSEHTILEFRTARFGVRFMDGSFGEFVFAEYHLNGIVKIEQINRHL